ncbi:MAG TPA: hypothetical protein VGL58_20660 [Caulobacteraceae bacterium]|jgi:hypothetical protein
MRVSTKVLGAVVAAVGLASAGPALAQSSPPFGYWSTADGGERLLIQANATCSLADQYGRPTTSGSCSWNASYAGGILTIMSSQLYKPAPVYFNVIWVNQNCITVDGDVFYRLQ